MNPHFFTAPFYFAFIWFRVQRSRGGFAATIPMTIHAAPSYAAHFSAFLICLSCRLCPILPCGAPSPRGEGCDTRIPSSKKGGTPPL